MLLSKLKGLLLSETDPNQTKSEAMIALATLIYQCDGKIKASEQAEFDKFLLELPWTNPRISKETFHSGVIGESRMALERDQIEAFVEKYCVGLSGDTDLLASLKSLAEVDGHVDDREAAILLMVTAKLG